MLCWTKLVSMPRAASSRVQKVRAKNPRASRVGFDSISQVPHMFVSTNSTAALTVVGGLGYGVHLGD
jgi:hypothetical protein